MAGKPLTLFLTKLMPLTPTLREVTALCSMDSLPDPLVAAITSPKDLKPGAAEVQQAWAAAESAAPMDWAAGFHFASDSEESDPGDFIVLEPECDNSTATGLSLIHI